MSFDSAMMEERKESRKFSLVLMQNGFLAPSSQNKNQANLARPQDSSLLPWHAAAVRLGEDGK